MIASLLSAAAAAGLGVAVIRQARRLDALGNALERLARRADSRSTPAPTSNASASAQTLPSEAGPVAPAARDPQPERAGHAVAPGPTLIEVPDLSTAGPEGVAADVTLGRRFRGIWQRADAGESAEAIARATGQPIGEVELILGLRRAPGAPATARDSERTGSTEPAGRPLP